VNDAAKGQEFIGRLYQLIVEYESDPTTLEAAGFGDLYQRVIRAIDLGGESGSAAFALDSALFNAVSLEDIGRSDLRTVVSHALTIYHRYHADYGRGYEQAYRWCEQSRRQQLPDLSYIHTYLVPLLLKPEAMGGNLDVCLFLLEQLGQFENLESSPVWDDDQAAELLNQEASDIVYQLARRKVKYSADKLTKVMGTLEQNLQKDQAFQQLLGQYGESTPLLAHLILTYGYQDRDSWWRRLGRGATGLFRGIVQRMAGEYMAYELTKRKGAYIVQVLLIVLIVVGLGLGLFGWSYTSHGRWVEIGKDLEQANSVLNEVGQERQEGLQDQQWLLDEAKRHAAEEG
jgi:hypothetical protein